MSHLLNPFPFLIGYQLDLLKIASWTATPLQNYWRYELLPTINAEGIHIQRAILYISLYDGYLRLKISKK